MKRTKQSLDGAGVMKITLHALNSEVFIFFYYVSKYSAVATNDSLKEKSSRYGEEGVLIEQA